MKFEVTMEKLLQFLIPVSIIVLILFLFLRNRTIQPYKNYPENIKNIIENANRNFLSKKNT